MTGNPREKLDKLRLLDYESATAPVDQSYSSPSRSLSALVCCLRWKWTKLDGQVAISFIAATVLVMIPTPNKWISFIQWFSLKLTVVYILRLQRSITDLNTRRPQKASLKTPQDTLSPKSNRKCQFFKATNHFLLHHHHQQNIWQLLAKTRCFTFPLLVKYSLPTCKSLSPFLPGFPCSQHVHEHYCRFREYFDRILLYRKRCWCCAETMKSGLSYQQALECERKARLRAEPFFPSVWIKSALEIIHLSTLLVPIAAKLVSSTH